MRISPRTSSDHWAVDSRRVSRSSMASPRPARSSRPRVATSGETSRVSNSSEDRDAQAAPNVSWQPSFSGCYSPAAKGRPSFSKRIADPDSWHAPSASQSIVKALKVNRSTLSRWRRCRGVIPVGGLPAIILARLHMRLVAAREAERSRFEARLDVKHGRLSEQTAGRCSRTWWRGAGFRPLDRDV
jgi:hypothetical protein